MFGSKAQNRREQRRANRLARQKARQSARTDRVESRQGAKATAYAAGIDPGAKWANLGGQVVDGVGKFASAKIFAGKGKGGPKGQTPPAQDNTMMLAAAAIGAYFLLKK